MYLKVQIIIISNGISVKCVFIARTRHTIYVYTKHTTQTHIQYTQRRKVDFAEVRHHITLLLFTPMMRLIECVECGDGNDDDGDFLYCI